MEPDYLRWVVRSVKDRPRLVACARLVGRTSTRSGTGDSRRPRPARTGHPAEAPAAPRKTASALPLMTRERAVLVIVATLAALATFLGAWLVITLLGR